jgi:chromosome segregation ATPase
MTLQEINEEIEKSRTKIASYESQINKLLEKEDDVLSIDYQKVMSEIEKEVDNLQKLIEQIV